MARGLNKVMLIGNLGRDPELRHTGDGKAVTNFSVAVNRQRRGADGQPTEETEWFRVVCFDRLAEIAGEYLHTGDAAYVEGRLQSRQYTDKEGVERTVFEVVAAELVLLGGRRDGQGRRGDEEEEASDVPF